MIFIRDRFWDITETNSVGVDEMGLYGTALNIL